MTPLDAGSFVGLVAIYLKQGTATSVRFIILDVVAEKIVANVPEIPFKKIQKGEILGTGAYAVVQKVKLPKKYIEQTVAKSSPLQLSSPMSSKSQVISPVNNSINNNDNAEEFEIFIRIKPDDIKNEAIDNLKVVPNSEKQQQATENQISTLNQANDNVVNITPTSPTQTALNKSSSSSLNSSTTIDSPSTIGEKIFVAVKIFRLSSREEEAITSFRSESQLLRLLCSIHYLKFKFTKKKNQIKIVHYHTQIS